MGMERREIAVACEIVAGCLRGELSLKELAPPGALVDARHEVRMNGLLVDSVLLLTFEATPDEWARSSQAVGIFRPSEEL